MEGLILLVIVPAAVAALSAAATRNLWSKAQSGTHTTVRASP